MKKKVGIIKRFSCLCLVFLLSINSFAAIVSDNDGSAFITKAEFDALKSSFQSQIDSYNQSIDSKIDGAIASYLAGMKLTTETQVELPLGWNDVVYMQNAISPEFTLPTYNLNMSFTAFSYSSNDNLKMFNYTGTYSYNKSWSTNATCKRALCGLLSGTESAKGTVYWRGVAQRFQEYFDLSFNGQAYYSDLACLDIASSITVRANLQNFAKLSYSGYLSNLNSTTFFNPSCQYYDGTYNNNPASWPKRSIVASAKVLLGTVNGKTTDYDHIIQYSGTTTWWLSNENWFNSFYQNSSNGNTSTTLGNNVTKSLASFGMAGCGSLYWHGSMSNSTYSEDGSRLTSIGMMTSTKRADAIYQLDGDRVFTINNKNYNISNQTLVSGYIATCAEAGQRIKWPVDFSEVYAYNGSSYVTNANEVDIYLSYSPFADQLTAADLIPLEQGTTTVDHLTTNGRKADVIWTMDRPGPVYVKCVPHFNGTSYLTNTWWIRQNLKDDYSKMIYYTE